MFAEGLDVFALGKSLPFSAAVLVRKDLPGQAAGGGSRAGPDCLGFSAVLSPASRSLDAALFQEESSWSGVQEGSQWGEIDSVVIDLRTEDHLV